MSYALDSTFVRHELLLAVENAVGYGGQNLRGGRYRIRPFSFKEFAA